MTNTRGFALVIAVLCLTGCPPPRKAIFRNNSDQDVMLVLSSLDVRDRALHEVSTNNIARGAHTNVNAFAVIHITVRSADGTVNYSQFIGPTHPSGKPVQDARYNSCYLIENTATYPVPIEWRNVWKNHLEDIRNGYDSDWHRHFYATNALPFLADWNDGPQNVKVELAATSPLESTNWYLTFLIKGEDGIYTAGLLDRVTYRAFNLKTGESKDGVTLLTADEETESVVVLVGTNRFVLKLPGAKHPSGQRYTGVTNQDELARVFVTAYNANDFDRALSVIDLSRTPEPERHAKRVHDLREVFTNISDLAASDFPRGDNKDQGTVAWIQIGGFPDLPATPKEHKAYSCTINGMTSGYLQISFPLVKGIAPTQALSMIIGLRQASQVLCDAVVEVQIESDR